jgi:hypothetical protein
MFELDHDEVLIIRKKRDGAFTTTGSSDTMGFFQILLLVAFGVFAMLKLENYEQTQTTQSSQNVSQSTTREIKTARIRTPYDYE